MLAEFDNILDYIYTFFPFEFTYIIFIENKLIIKKEGYPYLQPYVEFDMFPFKLVSLREISEMYVVQFFSYGISGIECKIFDKQLTNKIAFAHGKQNIVNLLENYIK